MTQRDSYREPGARRSLRIGSTTRSVARHWSATPTRAFDPSHAMPVVRAISALLGTEQPL